MTVELTGGTSKAHLEAIDLEATETTCEILGYWALLCNEDPGGVSLAPTEVPNGEGAFNFSTPLVWTVGSEYPTPCFVLTEESALTATPNKTEPMSEVALSGEMWTEGEFVSAFLISGALTVTPAGVYGLI